MLMFMVNERSLAGRVESRRFTRQARLRLKILMLLSDKNGRSGAKQ